MTKEEDVAKNGVPEWVEKVVRWFQILLDWNFFRYGKKGEILK